MLAPFIKLVQSPLFLFLMATILSKTPCNSPMLPPPWLSYLSGFKPLEPLLHLHHLLLLLC